MSLHRSPARSSLLALLALSTALPVLAQDGEGTRSQPSKDALPHKWVEAFEWDSIGPANMSGRITALAVFEPEPSTWWAATASGGLLKTVNNGTTFEHQFDQESVVSIGHVAVCQTDRDLVWVGTGESNPRNSVSWGNGVYKSVDGGRSWKHMGLEESYQISRVVIHPQDPDTVYVGALGRLWGPNEERGLYRTTDGGKSWERVLYVDDETGVIDIEVSPADPNTMLVATYTRRRDGFDGNDPAVKWGPGAGVWKTTDGGDTFRRIREGLPSVDLGRIDFDWYEEDPNVVYAVVESSKIGKEPEDAPYMGLGGEDAEAVGARVTQITKGGPAAEAGIKQDDILIALGGETVHSYADMLAKVRQHKAGATVEVEVSRDRKPHVLELTFGKRPGEEEDQEGEEGERPRRRQPQRDPFGTRLGGQIANIHEQQGDDGHEYGGVYRSEDGGDTWTRINSLNPRPMYFSQIRVDPSDEQRQWVLGISLHRSKDGGATYTDDGIPSNVHVDHHDLWIDPANGKHMILGNDGGIYVTWDAGETWDHLNHVSIGQFYHVTVGPRRDYRVYGGLQDNGSWGGPRRHRSGGTVNEDWIRIGGGDGFVCRVDPQDPDQVYYESQNGGLGRRNLRTGERGFLRPRAPRGTRYRFNWKTPFVLSHHNSAIYYTAGNHVFRSFSKGDRLEPISEEITLTDRGSATALAESRLDPNVLYVGTDDGAVHGTTDGGRTWTDLFGAAAPDVVAETQEGARSAEEAEDAANGEDSGAMQEVSLEDDVSGEWSAKATGQVPNGQAEFGFQLVLGEDGSVRGEIQTQMGEGSIQDGRYEPEKKQLFFRFEGERMPLDVTAEVADGAMSGTLSVGGGVFEVAFEASRTAEEAPVEVVQQAEEDAVRDARSKEAKASLSTLVDKPMWVSSMEASRFEKERVYATLDGHRSDDDRPYAFVSEDHGKNWRSLTADVPDWAGSARVLREDIKNPDILYLGCEMGLWVSIDRGETWTALKNNLPTVAVHEVAQHETAGEIVAGTHGRSLWALDVTALRQMSREAVADSARLYRPNEVLYWHDAPGRGGGTRAFVGDNPSSSCDVYFSLGGRARTVTLEVVDSGGRVVHEFEEVPTAKGLHKLSWNLRTASSDNRRRGPRITPGNYSVVLTADAERLTQPLVVSGDPDYTEAVLWGELYDEWLEAERAHEEEEEEPEGDRVH